MPTLILWVGHNGNGETISAALLTDPKIYCVNVHGTWTKFSAKPAIPTSKEMICEKTTKQHLFFLIFF